MYYFVLRFPTNMTVVLGRESMKGQNLNEVSRVVDKIITHPAYDAFNYDNDMALLKLSSPVNFTHYIQPVCLASANSTFYTGDNNWVVGFGAISLGKLTDSTLDHTLMGTYVCCLFKHQFLSIRWSPSKHPAGSEGPNRGKQ